MPMGKSTSNSGHDPVRVRTSDPNSARRTVSSDLEPVMEGFPATNYGRDSGRLQVGAATIAPVGS